LRGNRLSTGPIGIGHAYQLSTRHIGIFLGMKLAQVSDPDHTYFQCIHQSHSLYFIKKEGNTLPHILT
jgi:hypothetical protein